MSRTVRWGPTLLGAVAALLVGWSSGAAAQQQIYVCQTPTFWCTFPWAAGVPNGTACQCNNPGGPVAGISFSPQQAGLPGQMQPQRQPGQSRDGKDRHVDIINATNVVVNSFYASNVDRTTWEEDMLGGNVLAPGQRLKANIDDGTGACLFDFKAMFADGRSMEDRRVDVCQIASWTITPQGPRRQLPQQQVPQQQVPQPQVPPQPPTPPPTNGKTPCERFPNLC